MRAMEIDDEGLDSTDRKLLAAIIQKFGSGPVGVAALAAVLSEEVETIEDVYEPFLLRLGFIDRTPQGRIATELARAHMAGLGYEIPPPRRADPAWSGCGTSRRRTPSDRRRTSGAAARYEVTTPPPADGSTRARAGTLTLTHGVVETPQFMPVGTNATVKALSPGRHPRASAPRSSSSNTYHLYLRPGHERIARLGGLHRFMDWDGPILTDSGGFQVVSLGDLRVVDEDGVTFRSHIDGSTHTFTPELAIGVQEALGLGHRGRLRPAGLPDLAAGGRRRCDRADPSLGGALARGPHRAPTRRCSGSSRAAWSRTCARRPRGSSPTCRSTASASAGWPATRRPAQRDAALDVVVPLLADDPRPRYLMGLGSPADLLEAVDRGVDLFDSVLPARVARNGQLWIPGGRLNIRNQALPRRSGARSRRTAVPRLPALLAGLPGPSVPGRGAPRIPPRDLSQPDLHPRLHGQDPRRDQGRFLPRSARPNCACAPGRMSRSEGAEKSA